MWPGAFPDRGREAGAMGEAGEVDGGATFADSDPQILAELERRLADLRLIRRFAGEPAGSRWGLAAEATARLRRDPRSARIAEAVAAEEAGIAGRRDPVARRAACG